MQSIGIDLGGSYVKGVLLSDKGEVITRKKYPVEEGDDTLETHWKIKTRSLFDELKSHNNGNDFSTGISAPGLADSRNTAIACMPERLRGLEYFNWSDFLQHPVAILNDAHAALLSESRHGIGKGYNHLVMITLGTGVGGGLLINGEIYQGSVARAGHFGHTSIGHSPEKGITGTPGSLEEAIGNASLPTRSYGKYSSTEILVRDYSMGDPFAGYIWLTSVRHLAVGITSIINACSPDAVILGGGITRAGKDLFEPLKSFLDVFEWRPEGFITPILKAGYDEYSGAIGAAIFAENRVNKQ